MPDLYACPPELTAASGPLAVAGQSLRAVANDRPGIEHLADGSPSPAVAEAISSFIERWELVLWDLGGDALALADGLRNAASRYADADRRLAQELSP